MKLRIIQSPVTSCLIGPHSSSAPYSGTPLAFVPPSVERPSFTPIQNNRQNYSSVYFNAYIFERQALMQLWCLIDKAYLQNCKIVTYQSSVARYIYIYIYQIPKCLILLFGIASWKWTSFIWSHGGIVLFKFGLPSWRNIFVNYAGHRNIIRLS
jgi:hypothetical protein